MRYLLTMCIAVVGWTNVCAGGDSPLKAASRLGLPAIVLDPPYTEWVQMYRLSEKNPSQLLLYLEDEYLNEKVPNHRTILEEDNKWRQLRWYALARLGDTANSELIPLLEEFALRWEKQTERTEVYQAFADLARLTIERIRYRMQGTDTYIRAMMQWAQLAPPTLQSGAEREWSQTWRRKQEGIRALGVAKAREAVPLLIQIAGEEDGGYADSARFAARALARIGDRRAMEVLRNKLTLWLPRYTLATHLPLEPDEPDVAWAYWVMRTDRMKLSEAIDELIRSIDEPALLRQDQVLRHLGKPAVPALIAALKDPSTSSTVKGVAIGVLADLQAQEAAGALLDILRDGKDGLRADAAHALGILRTNEALMDLMEAAKQDENPGLKQYAIIALGLLGNSLAEPLLLDIVTTHADSNMRYVAAKALAKAGTPGSIKRLEQRLAVEPSVGVKGAILTTINSLRKKAR
jgi:HEAT repeat protein